MRKVYLIRLLRPLLHFLALLLIFFLVYKIRLVTDLIPGVQLPIPHIDTYNTIWFAIISSGGFIAIGILKGLYRLEQKSGFSFLLLSKVWIYWVVANTFLLYFGTGLLRQYTASRFILIFSALGGLVFLMLFDTIWSRIERTYYIKRTSKNLIISTNQTQHKDMIEQLSNDKTANYICMNIRDIVCDEQLKDYESIFIIGDVGKDFLQEIFEQIRFSSTRFFHFSEGYFVQDIVYKAEYVANTIAIEYKHSTLDGRSLLFKRIFDIIVSGIAIILLSPLFLIIAIIIKLDSKGPVFFFQKRVGKGGKEFKFVKFRSMVANAEELKKDLLKKNERKGPLFKIKNDPRITKVGKFLRKTSIDELPQLFCVLWGTMSLVGPRPHLPAEVAQYEEREKRLLSVYPGITGYAQVFGRDNIPFSQEAKLDLYYIQNWSVVMDIYVIFNTFLVVFKGK